MSKYIVALDQGTTSSRAVIFDENGAVVASHAIEFPQIYPKPGWVEHDANEIWDTQLEVAKKAMDNIGATAANIAAIGITNQRETTIVWDKTTGEPVSHAIVWQCRRTSEYCDSLKEKGLVLYDIKFEYGYDANGNVITETKMALDSAKNKQTVTTLYVYACDLVLPNASCPCIVIEYVPAVSGNVKV